MKPLEFTHIFVIESLQNDDKKTGTELFEDVIRRRMMQKGVEQNCELMIVNTKSEFFDALEKIKQIEVYQLANPVIHLELHGSENGLQVRNGENISWQELQFFLLQLNGVCGNNLFVTMASCKGGYIFKTIQPNAWTPFWGVVGPFEIVQSEEILANYTSFYDEFLQTGDINTAIQALHAANPEGYSKFRFNNTEMVFERAYENYEALYLTPEMIKARSDVFFAECRPLPDFKDWSDKKIRDFSIKLIKDEDGVMKRNLIRRFFMLDKFPEQEKYYSELLTK